MSNNNTTDNNVSAQALKREFIQVEDNAKNK